MPSDRPAGPCRLLGGVRSQKELIMRLVRPVLSIMLVGLLVGLQSAQASGKRFTTIDAPRAGSGYLQGTTVTGINDRGDIVGYYSVGKRSHGFLLHQGKYTTIDVPQARQTWPSAINRQGDIVGRYTGRPSDGLVTRGFLLHGGKYTTFAGPNAHHTEPLGINARGDIVGRYIAGTGDTAFLLRQGKYTTLQVPGARDTWATGVNDQGDVVGSYSDSKVAYHGFLWHQGRYTTINHPRAGHFQWSGTMPQGINQHGDIVGVLYLDGSNWPRGFLWHGGRFTTIEVPKARKTRASDINASGGIVGYYSDSRGVIHGFLWR